MERWSFEQNAAGRSVIRHNAYPRFCAYWTSGAATEAAPLEPWWSDAGSGQEDRLHLYGIEWIDTTPEAQAVEHHMQEAAKAIDAWIVNRL